MTTHDPAENPLPLNMPPTDNNNTTYNLQTPPTQTPPTQNGYAHTPLPTLHETDIRLISHNINTLHTTSEAELGTTFDLYKAFNPTIIGLQECNKNWTQYDTTEGPLWNTMNR